VTSPSPSGLPLPFRGGCAAASSPGATANRAGSTGPSPPAWSRRLGPFDPEIFLYAEDLDLGLRAREADIETWFWPLARVVHHQSHATIKAFGGEPFERLARQRHDVVARRLGERAAARDDALQALTFANRVALKRLLGRPADREREQLAAVRRATR
jgi:N-acetylglucosaminyl-diphospho-decaprenol L-rhamnosyltransferase